MAFTSADQITRGMLFKKGLPIHWYAQYLKYNLDAIQELNYDTLQVVNSVVLSVNPNGMYAVLPSDYEDYTLIGVPRGQLIMPMVQKESISRLPNYNLTGQIVDYGTPGNDVDFGFFPGWWMFQTIDDLGENVGRLYGWNSGNTRNSFKVIKERGVIQLNEHYPCSTISLEYIGDGRSPDSATKVTPQARACIEAHANHQYEIDKIKANPTMIQIKEKEFGRQWRMLRARLSDATIEDIKQTLWRSYSLTAKN
jgi:hypothetical protein